MTEMVPRSPWVFAVCLLLLGCFSIAVLYFDLPDRWIRKILGREHHIGAFLKKLDKNGVVLDVGCGNDSPYSVKTHYPALHYVGIDVGDYNQQKPNLADEYIVTAPESFADTIAALGERFDAVISSHNLEHCNDREKTLDAMMGVLKPGGRLYLSFPTENSVNFPRRQGTLNYFDDPTHKALPPDFEKTLAVLRQNGMEVVFSIKSHQPFFLYLIGFLLEAKSKRENAVTSRTTWAYYGFETIIWARKNETFRRQ